MKFVTRIASRRIVLLLVCMLFAQSSTIAEAKPLTPESVHARILKRGLGNWVGVELQNGTAFAGRIVNIDDQSFGLQLHNDPAITPVLYTDVVRLHTGVPRGAFWGITAAGIGGVIVMAIVAHHEMAQMSTLPSQPVQPVFP